MSPGHGREALMKSRAKDVATIKRLELRLQLPSVRSSRAQLDQLLADEFMEFGSSGRIYDKRQIIQTLVADPRSQMPRYPALRNVKVIWLGDDVALLTFRSTQTQAGTSARLYANRSSVWKRNGGRWQMVFHQGTRVESDW
jgi:hypothetical protein